MRSAAKWAGLLCATVLLACQAEDRATKDRLDKMIAQAEDIERKMDKMPRGAAPSAPQQPRGGPDPTAVYSVPIEGSPVLGPATAKVTIVEAADFA